MEDSIVMLLLYHLDVNVIWDLFASISTWATQIYVVIVTNKYNKNLRGQLIAVHKQTIS